MRGDLLLERLRGVVAYLALVVGMRSNDVRTMGDFMKGCRGECSLDIILFVVVCVVENKRRVALLLLIHARLVAELLKHENKDIWSVGGDRGG